MLLSDRPTTRPNTRPIIRMSALAALLIAGATISACGYRPLYGQNGQSSSTPSVQARLASINVKPIPDRVGQMMRSALTHRLAPRTTTRARAYDISITLSESVATLAVEQSAFATRANLSLSANYVLSRKTDGLPLTSGSIKSVASYNILSSDFATRAAKSDSRSRAVKDVAEILRTRLAIYFQGPGLKQPALKTESKQP